MTALPEGTESGNPGLAHDPRRELFRQQVARRVEGEDVDYPGLGEHVANERLHHLLGAVVPLKPIVDDGDAPARPGDRLPVHARQPTHARRAALAPGAVWQARVVPGDSPAVTVLIGTFENEETLPRAVDSILGQSEPSLELLVIDDGSRDGSAAAARRAIGSDQRGRVIELGEHVGIPRSLNRGLRAASAPIVAIQDADDWSDRERLRRQLDALAANPDAAVVGSRMAEVDGSGRELRPRTTFRSGDVGDVLMRFNPIPNGCAAFRRGAVLELGGYDERCRYAADYDLWLRLAEHHRVITLDEVLATRVMGADNVAGRAEREQLGEAVAIRLRALRRRRTLRGASGLVRPALSYLVPMPLKRPIRRRRHQAP